jgi:hypothetical protein
MCGMELTFPSISRYAANGIITAFVWAYFWWPEAGRRQLSIKSICVLMFMEAITFAFLRWVDGQGD